MSLIGGHIQRNPDQVVLPNGWTLQDKLNQTIQVHDLSIHVSGLTAADETGMTVTGSAADDTTAPWERGYFELLERIAIAEDLKKNRDTSSKSEYWRPSKSNGVAIGNSIESAQINARLEAYERHVLLDFWYNQWAPENITNEFKESSQFLQLSYDLGIYKFSYPEAGAPSVIGYFAIPKNENLPLLMGFGCHQEIQIAYKKARGELLQRLGFLWGEPLPQAEPLFAPNAQFHLEYYLFVPNHGVLRKWLNGNSYRPRHTKHGVNFDSSLWQFSELHLQDLNKNMFVYRAKHPDCYNLTFGLAHPSFVGVNTEIRIHPFA